MSNAKTAKEHHHRPLPNTNRCADCGELIHNFEKPGGKNKNPDEKLENFNKSLGNAKDRVDHAAKMIGITLVLVILGLLTFPLGIILWVIAVGTFIAAFVKD
jgi:hypothetical protein